MRFVYTDTSFSVIQEGRSSIEEAEVLGIENSDDERRIYLDRLLDLPENRIPDGWRLEGVVSTVAIEVKRKVVCHG